MALGSAIKSIQQGTGTASVTEGALATANVTVTAVVLAKSQVRAWVSNPALAATYAPIHFSISPVLTSTTNLRLFITGATATATYTWEITEYY